MHDTRALVAAAGLLAGGAAAGQPADLILHHGRIWTVDDQQPRATAVAIADGRFLAVGSDEAALATRGPATEVIDLQGRFCLPGFNDSHVHFASAARFLEFNIMRVNTQEAFVERVRDVVARLAGGEWILGGYWGAYDDWAPDSPGGRGRKAFTPDLRLVEDLTRDHPMFIRRFDGSAFAANRQALRAAGLDAAALQAEGIAFERDARGRPTGILRGQRVEALFGPHLPREFSNERRLAQTRHALAELRRSGVTSISDMSDDEQLALYRKLRSAGALTCRVHFRYPLDRWEELADRGSRVGSGDAWIRLGALKGHIDGIMGTSSARFFEPYENDPTNRGRWRRLMLDEAGQVDPDRFLKYMLDADQAGLQLSIHAIGDEANHLLLNFLEELDRLNGPRDRRFRLVHAQVLAPADFARLRQRRIVAEVQPFHLADDMRWMEERIGATRCRGAYAFRTLAESGAVLAFGSDWPGTSAAEYPADPMRGLYAAVTRRTLSGEPPGGWFPDERISIQEAIKAYTWGGAYASFEEEIKGSIAPGKLADLVVLSRDLLTIEPAEIPKARVLMTIVDGEIVHRAGK